MSLAQPKRHAFLIAAHTDPEMARRLIRSLRHPRVDIFLHVDKRSAPEAFLEPGAILVSKPIAVQWGGWDLVEATLLLLKQAQSHARYDHFTHLSGQDYLLKPIEAVLQSIESGPGRWVDLSWSEEDRTTRWSFYHVTTRKPVSRLLQRLRRKLFMKKPYLRALPNGISYGCGSALWSLDRAAVLWMFEFLDRRPDVIRFFRNTAHTSELFVHCLMRSSPFRDELGEHTHYTDWSTRDYHPKVLVEEDFQVLLASGKWFARKFNSNESAALLDRLDESIKPKGVDAFGD